MTRPSSFSRQMAEISLRAKEGDAHAALMARYLYAELKYLEQLPEPPDEDTAILKKVKQSRKYQVWRLSHPFDPNIAVRTICWFDLAENAIIVVLFAGDKADMGDVFYDSVGTRSDQIIEQYLRAKGRLK